MAQGITVTSPDGKICCSKCGKTLSAKLNFYTFRDESKCPMCKTCLTMHVNNWQPETYLWILEMFDVPYIEEEWKVLLDRAYAKNPYKITGMTVLGKYLSKMKLNQFKNYRWADTEMLKARKEQNRKELGEDEDITKQKIAEMEEAYANGEISEAQLITYKGIEAPEQLMTAAPPQDPNSPYPANSDFEEVELIDVGADLTQDDKVYLAMKWGRLYHADEWVALEKLYNEFMNTFDIQGAARIDTLKKICKTSLKMDQAIDCGDVDVYQKLSRVYDMMMKSAKFTQAQNDNDGADTFDAVGTIVAFCEAEGGFIPKYEIKSDKDIVDTIIRDNREYLNTLVHNDSNLSQQIEQFLKKKEIMWQQKKDRERAKLEGREVELTDKDFSEYYDFLKSEKQEDIDAESEEY